LRAPYPHLAPLAISPSVAPTCSDPATQRPLPAHSPGRSPPLPPSLPDRLPVHPAATATATAVARSPACPPLTSPPSLWAQRTLATTARPPPRSSWEDLSYRLSAHHRGRTLVAMPHRSPCHVSLELLPRWSPRASPELLPHQGYRRPTIFLN
jgi:hypothetical protein